MLSSIQVAFLPSLVTPEELAGAVVVVIDVLRATTTIVHALAAGAQAVIPCLEIEEAQQRAAALGGIAVLAGERGGRPIAGFDLGNSPQEFQPQRIRGRTVVFTTTNGTRALLRCRGAERVLIAAFVNFSAVCEQLQRLRQVYILCAGTDGHVTREDVLLAGALVDDALRTVGPALRRNDAAEIAADAWRSAVENLHAPGLLRDALVHSQGGRNLIEIGQEDDVTLAAQIDRFTLVPELDPRTWSIRMLSPSGGSG